MKSVRLKIRVQPRASRNKLECKNGKVKVWVTAPPVDSKANEAVKELLAEALGVKKSAVSIVKGEKSRDKEVEILGVSEEEIKKRLGC